MSFLISFKIPSYHSKLLATWPLNNQHLIILLDLPKGDRSRMTKLSRTMVPSIPGTYICESFSHLRYTSCIHWCSVHAIVTALQVLLTAWDGADVHRRRVDDPHGDGDTTYGIHLSALSLEIMILLSHK